MKAYKFGGESKTRCLWNHKTDICRTEGFNFHTGNTFSKWNVLFLSAQKHILYLKIIEIDRTSEKDISIRTVKISIDLANDTSTS